MPARLLLLWTLAVSCCSLGYGQQGQVVDQTTGAPLFGATIYALTNQTGTTTDQEGQFRLALSRYPDTIVVSFIGYAEQLVPVTAADEVIRVALLPQSKLLPDVVVRAYREAEPLVPEKVSVVDYQVLEEGLLVLSFFRNRYQLQLLDPKGELLAESPVEAGLRPRHLYRSCLGGIYLRFPAYFRRIEVQSSQIQWGDTLSWTTYQHLFRPCKVADDSTFFTAYHQYSGQMWRLFAIPRDGRGGQMIHVVADEEQLVRLADEANLLRDKAKMTAPERVASMIEAEKIFARRIFYQPLAIDVFAVDQALVLFDYTNSKINWLSETGESIRSYPIAFHQGRKWEEIVVQDPVRETFYTFLRDNRYTYVFVVDPHTGLLEEKAALPEIYLKRLEVYDGRLYYLHRGTTFEEHYQYLYYLQLPE